MWILKRVSWGLNKPEQWDIPLDEFQVVTKVRRVVDLVLKKLEALLGS